MFDIYAAVTDRIVAEMEQGQIPWEKPWIAAGLCVSHATGRPYSLLNQILLGQPGEYLTFNQAQEEGGYIRKGEKGRMVVFWKWIDRKDEDGHVVVNIDTGKPEQVPFLRYYTVFHVDQCEGITPKYTASMPHGASAVDAAEKIIADYIAREHVTLIHQEGNSAYYQPSTDTVVLPLMDQFADTAEYYSTAFHEITHSTGHVSRLNRIADVAAFGSQEYSKEELVAELGASALVHHVGLETKSSLRNNAAYIQNWLTALKNDKKLIVSASSKAEKAVALILNDNEEGN